MNIKFFLKQRIVGIVFVAAIILTIFCAVKIISPKQVYNYSGEAIFEGGEQSSIVYDQIKLPVGVYRIKLEYQTDTTMQNLCTIEDGTVFNGGLLVNGETLHKNLTSTDITLWLFEGTESLQVQVKFCGEGSLKTGNLSIYETNGLWTMLLTVVWGITLFVLLGLAYGYYDKKVGIVKEKKSIAFGLFLIVLLASLPYMMGGTVAGADLTYHLQRIEGVKDGLLSGQFPVRLEPRWLFDHGYANAIFYCNTLLYLPAFFRLLGFPIVTCYSIYCIALNIATAYISYYCFSKIFKDRTIGLLCSALYTLSIFRIYKLVITGAVGEGSAVTFMPLVFYGLYRAFTEDVKAKSYKTCWIPITVGYAGLIQTHVLSCEITALLTIIVCVVFIKKIFVKETFWELAKGALSALAVSFWYLIPFLDYYMNENMHIRHVSGRTIQDRGLYIPQLFYHWWKMGENALSGDLGMVSSHAMGIGLILGIGFFTFLAMWFSGNWKQNVKNKIISMGKVSCAMGGMLMLMSLNIFPWDRIQRMNNITASLVSSLQFPNRFLGWGTVFLVAVCGCLLWYFGKVGQKWNYYIGIICILLGVTTSSMYLLDYVNLDKEFYQLYSYEGMGYGYISGGEYVVEGTEAEKMDFDVPSSSENVHILTYDKEYLHMWVQCTNNSGEAGYIELPLLHYTGYHAYVTSTGEELLTEKGTNNVIRVWIPEAFDDEIEVKYVSPVHWRISEFITYAWWLFIVVILIKSHWKRHEQKQEVGYV